MKISADVVILGGGCAGLWLLDALRRRGYRALLLENRPLGSGQTGCAQGILHSGLKYLFQAKSASLDSFQGVTDIWRAALAGQTEPNLARVQLRSQACYLWRTDSLTSQLGLALARHGLKTRPVVVPSAERPAVLANCAGQVLRIDEQVIDPISLLAELATRCAGHVWHTSSLHAPRFQLAADGSVQSVVVRDARLNRAAELHARHFVFSAGEGNAALRESVQLSPAVMQRRPLHVAYVVGDLPLLNGHCVDGAGTRVTITSDVDSAGRVAWQLGGSVSETGAKMTASDFLPYVRAELAAVLPQVNLTNCEWFARRIDRAERKTAHGGLPSGPQLLRDRNVLTLWPSKLVLAPLVPDLVARELSPPQGGNEEFAAEAQSLGWHAPPIAVPAWQEVPAWKRAA